MRHPGSRRRAVEPGCGSHWFVQTETGAFGCRDSRAVAWIGAPELGRDLRAGTTFAAMASEPVVVGEWYLHSRSAHRDARVVQAYRQLQEETDQLFTLLTRNSCRCAVRVVFTRCAQPYKDDRELISAVRASGTLEVSTAANAEGRLHPLLDCDFGGAFDRFRAVHDLIGHARCGYGFDLNDECAAWGVQDRLHSGLARSALATELYGVNAARGILGDAPDLRALLMRPGPGRPRSGPHPVPAR